MRSSNPSRLALCRAVAKGPGPDLLAVFESWRRAKRCWFTPEQLG